MNPQTSRISVPFAAEDFGEFIFASYAHADKELVFPVIKRLHEGGWRVWYDQGIEIAEFYDDVIAQHVKDCALFLLFVSAHSIGSYYTVQNELKYALRLGKRVVLYWLEQTELPPSLDMLIGGERCEWSTEPDIFAPFHSLAHGEKRKAFGLTLNATGDKPLENDEYDYEIVANGVVLTHYKGNLGEVRVPARINGQPVVGLARTFDESDVVSADIPESVTELGIYCFGSCAYLERLNLPPTLKIIGESAFYGCDGLERLVLPPSLEYIADTAFYNCFSLRELVVSSAKTRFGEDVFGEPELDGGDIYNPQSEGLTIRAPKGSTAEAYARKNNIRFLALEAEGARGAQKPELPFPSCVEKPFIYASYAAADARFTVPRMTALYEDGFNVRWDEGGGFSGRVARDIADCEFFLAYLTANYASSPQLDNELRLANHLRKKLILIYLERCELPTELQMTEGGRQGLCVWDMPLEEIGIKVRNMLMSASCRGRAKLAVKDLSYRLEGGKIELLRYTGNPQRIDISPEYFPAQPTVKICNYCFQNCETLREINIPDSVELIGYNAFEGCRSLQAVRLPAGLRRISVSCFSGCSSLRGIDLPPALKAVSYNAFENSALELLRLPPSVTELGKNAFLNCSSLRFAELSPALEELSEECFKGCTALEGLRLSPNIKQIGASCFEGCRSLVELYLPDSTTVLGYRAFYGCSSLKKISTAAVGECAFSGCTALEFIELREGVTSISPAMLEGCAALAAVFLPRSIVSLRSDFLSGCDRAVAYVFKGSNAERLCIESGIRYAYRPEA